MWALASGCAIRNKELISAQAGQTAVGLLVPAHNPDRRLIRRLGRVTYWFALAPIALLLAGE